MQCLLRIVVHSLEIAEHTRQFEAGRRQRKVLDLAGSEVHLGQPWPLRKGPMAGAHDPPVIHHAVKRVTPLDPMEMCGVERSEPPIAVVCALASPRREPGLESAPCGVGTARP